MDGASKEKRPPIAMGYGAREARGGDWIGEITLPDGGIHRVGVYQTRAGARAAAYREAYYWSGVFSAAA